MRIVCVDDEVLLAQNTAAMCRSFSDVDEAEALNSGREALEWFEMKSGQLRLLPEKVSCDLYRFLDGDADAVNRYRGEYMSAYPWAAAMEGFATNKKRERIRKTGSFRGHLVDTGSHNHYD